MSTLVFGHKNPDTDSVCAAITLANLKKALGEDTAPAMQGQLTPESKFVLENLVLPLLKWLPHMPVKMFIWWITLIWPRALTI